MPRTVGGNICMSLPAAPMITMMVALEAMCRLWTPADGSGIAVLTEDFVGNTHQNVLRWGKFTSRLSVLRFCCDGP